MCTPAMCFLNFFVLACILFCKSGHHNCKIYKNNMCTPAMYFLYLLYVCVFVVIMATRITKSYKANMCTPAMYFLYVFVFDFAFVCIVATMITKHTKQTCVRPRCMCLYLLVFLCFCNSLALSLLLTLMSLLRARIYKITKKKCPHE